MEDETNNTINSPLSVTSKSAKTTRVNHLLNLASVPDGESTGLGGRDEGLEEGAMLKLGTTTMRTGPIQQATQTASSKARWMAQTTDSKKAHCSNWASS